MGGAIAGTTLATAAAAAGAVFIACPLKAAAAVEQPEPFDQIVVVANKDQRSIRNVAASVTVIDNNALDEQLAASLAEAFRYLPGIDYEASGTRFGTEGISIRGIGGNRVAILVDGIPLSDQFDVGSFSNATRDLLDAGFVDGVEVLHGPASALYGSEALGGVVSVRTPDPSEPGTEFRAAWHGADSSSHLTALTSFAGDRTGLVLGASVRAGAERDASAATSALDTRDDARRTGLIKLVHDDVHGNTWRASVIVHDVHTLSDSNSMLGTGRFRSTTALEGDDRHRSTNASVAWEFSTSWLDTGTLLAFVQTADTEQATLDERAAARIPVSIDRFFAFDQRSYGADLNLWKNVEVGTVTHRLGFGVEYRQRRTEEYRDGHSTDLTSGLMTNVLLGEVFPLRDFPVSDTRETAVYLEDSFSVGNWTMIAALRADSYQLDPSVDPMYLADYPFAEPVAIDETEVSPKLGLVYHLSPATEVFVQYSHGFRAPPFAEANVSLEIPFFNYRAVPNPDLRSESSDGLELGLRWRGDTVSAWASAFRTRYRDFIESKVRIGTDPDSGRILFQSQNLDETMIHGVEAGLSVRQGGWSADAAAYLARGENRANGEPLNSVGPAQAVFGAGWQSSDARRSARLRLTVVERWDQRDETGGELFKPAGHAIFDLFATWRVGERTTLRAAVNNLTDRTAWRWSDVRGMSANDPSIPYLSMSGRSASIGVDVSW